MGLFSTLASSGKPETSLSSDVATVVQLYTKKPIELDTSTAKVTGYTAMTYQAVQVGMSADDLQEPKNRHQNPDLGIWNCCVRKSATNEEPLVDHLLSKVAKNVPTFCWTIDLSDESKVEPTVNILQEALVRHLIEKSSISDTEQATTSDENAGPDEEDRADNNAAGDSKQRQPKKDQPQRVTATTSLYDLRSLQFGLAAEDKTSTTAKKNASPSNIEKTVKTTLMICAITPSLYNNQEVSEVAYRKKLARALVIYHLRRFASALNASLCFVSAPPTSEEAATVPPSSTPTTPTTSEKQSDSQQQQQQQPANDHEQPTVSLDKLAQLWRDLAMDKEVWARVEEDVSLNKTSSGEEKDDQDKDQEAQPAEITVTVHSTPIYGPGYHHEDLIETVLLRDANYPGHWDSSKDSLWVALPIPDNAPPEATTLAAGDEGWLTQLRNSIASAEPPKKAATPDKTADEKPKEKDAAVSSFFESLLKNP